ncbi:MAG: hypothetical protein KBT36_17915 [Kurthia sp.]|nr:hypothetical protein [Candidatus Kurthia equi]
MKKFFIGSFQPVIWLQGYQKHKKTKVLKIPAKSKLLDNPDRLIATDAAPKAKPNQDLIKGALGELIDRLFIVKFFIKD